MNDGPSPTRFGRIRRSPWVIAGASALVPGIGHLALGFKRRALGLLSVTLVGVVIFGIGLIWFQIDLLKLWVMPTALTP